MYFTIFGPNLIKIREIKTLLPLDANFAYSAGSNKRAISENVL